MRPTAEIERSRRWRHIRIAVLESVWGLGLGWLVTTVLRLDRKRAVFKANQYFLELSRRDPSATIDKRDFPSAFLVSKIQPGMRESEVARIVGFQGKDLNDPWPMTDGHAVKAYSFSFSLLKRRQLLIAYNSESEVIDLLTVNLSIDLPS